MKWATYRSRDAADTVDRVGLLVDGSLRAMPVGTKLVELLGEGGRRLRNAAQQVQDAPSEIRPLADARLRPVIPNPPAIRDFSSFLEHYRAGIVAIGKTFDDNWFNSPVFYFSNPNSLVTDGDDVRIPGETRRMDYELEVAAIIGEECIDLDPQDADSVIAGYCIYNDWSARDIQTDEMGRAPIGPAKGKDSANGIGPYLVTPDELADKRTERGFDLEMTASVNGKLFSRGNWSTVYWSFAEMVAYASRNARLVPGDIIGAGTVGTGCILELSLTHGSGKFPWLEEGDEVLLTVERLGQLRNRIVRGASPKPLRRT